MKATIILMAILATGYAAVGCTAGAPDDNGSNGEDVRTRECSKALADAVRADFDAVSPSLKLIEAKDLPKSVQTALKAVNVRLENEWGTGPQAKPYKLESSAGTAFVLLYPGSDDDGAIVEAFSESGKNILSGESPCSCESIEWTDRCTSG